MKLHWSLRLLLAAISGYVWSIGFVTRFESLGAVLFLGILISVLLSAPKWFAFCCGFVFGAVFHTASLPWVYSVMRVHGNLGPAAAAGAMALLVVYLSLFLAVFSLCVAILSKKSVNGALVAAPFVWVALEYGQTHMPVLGFPWNLAGYIPSKNSAFVQLASLTGIYGLSFFIVAFGAMFAWISFAPEQPYSKGQRRTIGLSVIILFVLVAFGGGRFVPAAKSEHVAYLVQTNFPESPSYPSNWMDVHAGEMDELERISAETLIEGVISSYFKKSVPMSEPGKAWRATGWDRGAAFIIWPEVPAPFYFLDQKFATRAERIARESRAHLLVGVVEWRPGPENRMLPYNSAVMLDPSGKRVFQYDKIHLVPFGEYVPLRRWLKFVEHLVAEVGDYQPGREYSVGQMPYGKFGVGICYEAIFPNEMRQFTANGAELLINISNDGWYGRSAAPDQLLAMARVRAVENRRWLLRATNNGYTVAIDPYGREVARLDVDIRGVLRAPFGFRSDRTIYSRFGDWFAWLCVIIAIGFLLMPAKKPVSLEKGIQEVRK